ncbi:oxidoreductase [Achromobacter pulmonis]|uniref:Oxidoreductase n=1 Tax=Achromobacter pulmonis TaxID=1389932 RepID=A0A2N8KPQ2_9BURK|nr:MDR family oxidoreductase [Achromobacter pulmonis]PND35453.1 oxidoreductase [Achromobacter pulmonis]
MKHDDPFKALLLTQDDGRTLCSLQDLSLAELPAGDVTVKVEYSSLNYKDAMAVTGKGGIVRDYPMVPGIDLAGTVLESAAPDYPTGAPVVLTGWSVGERYWGGYAQVQRVRSEWLVPLAPGLDSFKAMAIGTAGLTAMLCVMELEAAGLTPAAGPVLVTGASGGVGSVAVALLAGLGWRVAALVQPGREAVHPYLKSLGASEIVSGPEWAEMPRPLEKQRWAGAVDTVGSKVLARTLAATEYGGAVAACGLAGGADLPGTVMPFILRGVRLLGVDSVMCPPARRRQAWERLGRVYADMPFADIAMTAGLSEVPQLAARMMAGNNRGRYVIDVSR